MTDDQCQALIDSIKDLTNAIVMNGEKIADAIDYICMPHNEGIERKLEALMDVIDTASYRGSGCNYQDCGD